MDGFDPSQGIQNVMLVKALVHLLFVHICICEIRNGPVMSA